MIEQLQFKKLSELAILPTRGSVESAGLDLYTVEAGVIPAHGFATFKTGLSVAVPVNHYARIAPRSGLSAKHGVFVLAGVVDSDYRGEIMCVLANLGNEDYIISVGDRIAQMVIEVIATPEPIFVEELSDTDRGSGGLGSTGKN